MRDFEDLLRSALAKTDAPPGFTEKVMASIPLPPRRVRWWESWGDLRIMPRWAPAAAALVIAVTAAGSWQFYRLHEQQKTAEKAKNELIYALKVTSAKLELTRTKLRRHTGGNL